MSKELKDKKPKDDKPKDGDLPVPKPACTGNEQDPPGTCQ